MYSYRYRFISSGAPLRGPLLVQLLEPAGGILPLFVFLIIIIIISSSSSSSGIIIVMIISIIIVVMIIIIVIILAITITL